jgi:glycosyltransferase involved in cell wall biosynthesis
MNVPRIAAVIPTFERPAFLARVLARLNAQTLDPLLFEVLVVDDASRPELATENAAACARVAAQFPDLALRYLRQPVNGGPAAARNRGWCESRAPVIAFTDDDTEPSPRWLEEGLRAIDGFDAAAGRVVVPLDDDPTDYERDAARLSQAEFVTANCFVTRAALEAVGGFDERYRAAWREDADLQFALEQRRMRIGDAARAVVWHPVRPAPWGVSLRQQRKVVFDALLYKKFPRNYRARIRPRPPWDYYAMTVAVVIALAALLLDAHRLALFAGGVWLGLTLRFATYRLVSTRRDATHVMEMLVTSAVIPLLSVFWRIRGGIRYRVLFL